MWIVRTAKGSNIYTTNSEAKARSRFAAARRLRRDGDTVELVHDEQVVDEAQGTQTKRLRPFP
jgi:hypothetical protein